MRHLVFNRPLPAAALFLVCLLFLPVITAAQSEDADTTRAEVTDTTRAQAMDTTVVDDAGEAPAKPEGRVKISIDEDGISIEGKANIATPDEIDDDEWIEIHDVREKYKEKGADIVRFRESVFVASEELVRGDLVVFGGNAVIEGRVTGNVIVIFGDIRARSGAVIKGDAVVIAGDLDEDEDVIVSGERVEINNFAFPDYIFSGTDRSFFKFVFFPLRLFIWLVLAFLLLLFLSDRVVASKEHLAHNYLKNFGVGFLAAFIGIFAIGIASSILIITILGIPLAILLWISCVGVLVFSWTVFAYSLGQSLAKKLSINSDNAFLFVFIGAVVINLPSIIAWGINMTFIDVFKPLAFTFGIVGWFVKGFAYLAGLGALVLSRFGSRPLDIVVHSARPAAVDPGSE